MWKKGPKLKYLDVFKITEEPEEATNRGSNEDVLEKLELLKAELLKLGKSQIQTRTFARSEYQALREAVEMLSANNDEMTDMVIEGLLPIADGLDAGIKAGSAMPGSEMDSWLNGLKIVHQRVMELLEKLDVHPIYSTGESFNPARHKAVAVEHTQEVNDNVVLEEQRRGYIRGDKVIRYAEVIVNKRSHEHAIQVEENGS
jgi:molecular chaperone GrpE